MGEAGTWVWWWWPVDVEAKDDDGNTPLRVAASNGDVACVRQFVIASAELDSENGHGRAPLQVAISNGNRICAPPQRLVESDDLWCVQETGILADELVYVVLITKSTKSKTALCDKHKTILRNFFWRRRIIRAPFFFDKPGHH